MPPSKPQPVNPQGQLENLARQLAESHVVSKRPGRKPYLLDRVHEQEVLLRGAYQYFAGDKVSKATAFEVQIALSYAAEWILDNFYVMERALRQVRADMPASYYRQLPKLDTSPLEGYPRVYALARELIGYCESHLDLDRVTRFVQAYQTIAPLTMGELWALPTMLRLGVLESLSRAAASAVGLRDESKEFSDIVAIPLPDDLEDEAIVAHCILSLRMLAAQDWKTFFESVSLVEQVLRRDPASIYARMDFDTRDRYRGVIEELALAAEKSEQEVAQEAIELARIEMSREESVEVGGEEREYLNVPRAAHVGFYLLDDGGRARLELCLGCRISWGQRLSRWLLGHPTLVYLGGIALFTLSILLGLTWYARAAGGTLVQLIGVCVLTALPASAMAISMVNWIITHTVPPRLLPRMDFQDGVPAECRTMVVVPAIIASTDEVQSLLRQLEIHFLGNRDPHLHFALLADLSDAEQKHLPGDARLIEQAISGVQALNQKYGQDETGPFYLFYRERELNPAEDCWMGWERKRGKLVELNRLLSGEENSYVEKIGNLDFLPEIKYVITLDADTLLPRESARRLIAALAHPLNRAEFDSQSGDAPQSEGVLNGYTVLQPRVEIKPTSASRSLFTRMFCGDAGLDLYTRAVSDVYQDLFGEGIYAGKGIYDVAAFRRSLAGRAPENRLLSHDLFEGIHGRAGLITDEILYEQYPSHYLAYTRRLHRWVRGDWQLLPWLLPHPPLENGDKSPSPLSVLDRWKILDNLRRSLLSPALLVMLIVGWTWLPGSPWLWTLAGLISLSMPVFTGVIGLMRQRVRETSLIGAARSVRMDVLRWLAAVVFLPYEALIIIDAVASSLHRLLVSRKRLLQWTTSAHTVHLFGKEMKVMLFWRRMEAAPLLALGLAWLVILADSVFDRTASLVAAPLLLAWMLSPYAAYWISRPIVHEPKGSNATISAEQRQHLRRLARRTWLYFERFVGPDDQWLPPDHFQEDPLGLVAHRTSPTNLGLMLLSALASYDLGYTGPLDILLRLRPTFESMGRLERRRGHFLNWYDTGNLKPLPPRYVSTVDSGNLAGCLLVLKQGCSELPQAPVLRWQRWQGVLDTLGVLAEVAGVLGDESPYTATVALQDYVERIRQQILAARNDVSNWASLLARLGDESWPELERLLISLVKSGLRGLESATLRDLRIWAERVNSQLLSMQSEQDMLLPWLLPLSQSPTLFTGPDADPVLMAAWQSLLDALPSMTSLSEIPDVCSAGQAQLKQLENLLPDGDSPAELTQAARDWCLHLTVELASARMAAESLLIGFRDLSDQAEAYFREMDFNFLFDKSRHVFHIGYNVETGALDNNYYDLLASEARIASLLAIAKGDVPQSHWMHLARPITQVDGARALLSWGGTMFEYLMPLLMVRRYAGSLLEQSNRAAVAHQIAHARRGSVPWGISESGYYRFDAGMHYQYRGFGVPGLGLRRGLGEDTVIAPYASLLALPLRPQAVMRNIARLTELQMLGRYGFYEAIDYTRSHLPPDQKSAIVYSYMVHHQGMTLLSLTNYLHDDVMVRRFHTDPRVQSVQLLLQEQSPLQAPIEHPHPEDVRPARPLQPRAVLTPWRAPLDSLTPHVHTLSNGRYSVLITSAGGGYSSWQDGSPQAERIALTRWRADTTLDNWGTWIYVQERDVAHEGLCYLWSAGYRPTCVLPEEQEVLFYAHQAKFWRRDRDLCVRTEITVPPGDDVEVRRVTLINHSDRVRHLTLTSYAEVVLASQLADRRHPAFNKLFIESGRLPGVNGLLFHRRPRSVEEEPIYLAHLAATERAQRDTGAYESDRARFLGRGGAVRSPAALGGVAHALSGTMGATLDPIMALGQEIELAPHATAQMAFVTLAGRTREEVLELARRYRKWSEVGLAFDRARSHNELELRRLALSMPEVERIQQLLSALLYPRAALRAAPATLAANSEGQPGLWAYGISGDYPILLAHVGDEDEIGLVHELLQAHAYWRGQRIKIDLVILNERETGYDQELHGRLHRLIARTDSDAWLNRRGGIFVLRADQMSESGRVLLETSARVVLDGEKGLLAKQLSGARAQPVRLPLFIPTLPGTGDAEPTPPLPRPKDLLFDNGLGGFSADGREYVIYLEPGRWTPAPWINVVANPDFGFLVSEAGAGYTWAGNSGENRLTPWRNDSVSDAPGEALYLRDEETAQVWSPTPLPANSPAPYHSIKGSEAAPYLIRHGAGYSTFEHHSHGLKQRLCLFVVPDAPVKVIQLRLENTWNRMRRITATFYAEWVLGADRDAHQQYVIPEFDAASNGLLARNPYNQEFGERVAFAVAGKELHGLTADRAEFLGRGGDLGHPAALERIGLSGAVEAGSDPCAALQIHIDLPPGEAQEVFFLLGQGADRDESLRLIEQYRDPEQVDAAWEAVQELWDGLLGTVAVQTPDPAMNLLLNRWLLYQALACRIWGRSAFYQSSGAFGYRDQLQDVMALLHAAPGLARAHILQAARHQFEEGDVLHWWHPPSGRGVRTRCSDDLLWLPFVTAHYVATTGDETILSEKAPFLKAAPLESEEVERYGYYETTAAAHTLYTHCLQALDKGTTVGFHGLPLLGSHDWNDGMSRVGIEGQGESVWLGWFLYAALTRFAPLCERMGDEERADGYRHRADALRQSLEQHAWDGDWYRRAYYDDGVPLGSSESDECQIDSIAQSWAVLSRAAEPKRAAKAMDSVVRRLVRQDDRLILLFAPPFDETARDPGYIKGYPPGIRENGGQYTHAALWAVWAFAELGQGDRAEALFRLLNPIYYADTPEKAWRYQVEPYVVAADVYSVEPYIGRGGWTWYTGSAGWMYRLGVEAILGLRRAGDTLCINPCIPSSWQGYELTYRYGKTVYRIYVDNSARVNQGIRRVILDGKALAGETIPLLNDGRLHQVRVLMGNSTSHSH
ncbi:MAG: hypothetical protein DRJ03_07595 [Chloroflexi bacterium]|nr:MAG: hypothetical protein DRJ03_07595 [Chloroflexota bacterium]